MCAEELREQVLRAPDPSFFNSITRKFMNWVFSLFNLEFTKEDFAIMFLQFEYYKDEAYSELETLDAAFHLSIGPSHVLLHIMGFNIIAI